MNAGLFHLYCIPYKDHECSLIYRFARPRLAFLTGLGKALFASNSLEILPEFSQNWIHVPALSMHVPIISYINKRKLVLLGFGVVVIYFKESTMFSSVLFPELECVSYCVVLSSFITAYMN